MTTARLAQPTHPPVPQCQDHSPHGLSGGHTPCPQKGWRTHHTLGVSGYLDRHQLHGNFSPWWQTPRVHIWTPILVYSQQMSPRRTFVLDWQTELCLSDHPHRPQFCATLSTSPLQHTFHITMSPWIVKPVVILPGGSGSFLLGMARPLYLIPTGPNRQIWNSSRMPLAVLAMTSSTWATGLLIPGSLNSGTDQFSGKSSTPLPLHAFPGGISCRERSSSPLPLRQPSSNGYLGFWHFLRLPYYASCLFHIL